MRGYGLLNTAEKVDSILPASLADREHGFDESEPFGAVAAECDFALYNGFAERSFGGIIRGMYALGAKECPKRRPETDEVM